VRDESGATAIEYGMIVALMALVIVSGISLLGGQVNGMWGIIESRASAALSGGG
jgi:pilus assembly protein Flp/PilA